MDTVLRIRREIGLGPSNFPTDFDGLYLYALADYGVGRPSLLDLFRHDRIRRAFRRSFVANDFSILDREADKFVDGHHSGPELQQLEIDIPDEIRRFASLFTELVEQSRTPVEIQGRQIQWATLEIVRELQSHQVSRSQDIDTAAFTAQREHFAMHIVTNIERELVEMRSAWRQGQYDLVRRWTSQQRTDSTIWETLPKQIRAEIILFQAREALDLDDDLDGAQGLVDEAIELELTPDSVILNSIIAYRRSGVQEALDVLGDAASVAARNLRAELLLQSGELERSIEELEKIVSSAKADSETFRIRAVAHVVSGETVEATAAIRQALDLEPKSKKSRYIEATIGYLAALSPYALGQSLGGWPPPVQWLLIRVDVESSARLRRAAETFEDLAANTARNDDELSALKIWRLACLGNDHEHQTEAADLCRAILEHDPMEHRAIAWAIARNWGIDVERSISALRQLVNEAGASIEQIIALVQLCAQRGDADDARILLESTKNLFVEGGGDDTWLLLAAHTTFLQSGTQAAINLLRSQDTSESAAGLVAEYESHLTGDPGQFEAFLSSRAFGAGGDAAARLELCLLKAEQRDWEFVAEHAWWLVQSIATGEVLDIAATATFNAGQFRDTLDLLDNHRNLLSEDGLSSQQQLMRVISQRSLGILPAAIADAQLLLDADQSPSAIMNLAETHYVAGDLKSTAVTLRRLVDADETDSEMLLKASGMVAVEDSELARVLWRQAIDRSVPESHLGIALLLSFQLGFDRDSKPIFERLSQLDSTEAIGFQSFSLDEMRDLVVERSQHAKSLDEIYRAGRLPIHVIVQQLNAPLVSLFHDQLARNAADPDPAAQPMLLVRHGGRSALPTPSEDIWDRRLAMDITATLLATHLGILDLVEQKYAPVLIPFTLIPALHEMRGRIPRPQISRITAGRLIVELVEEDRITVASPSLNGVEAEGRLVEQVGLDWAELYAMARHKQGFVVDFLPLRQTGTTDPIPFEIEGVIPVRAILDALVEHGPLSEDRYSRALEHLGTEGAKYWNGERPQHGSHLFFSDGTLELLAGSDVLRVVANSFNVHISHKVYEGMRASLSSERYSQQVSEWTGSLIAKLSQGINAGAYEVLPADVTEPPEDDGSYGVLEECIFSLLKIDSSLNAVLWIDDRFASGYQFSNTSPIVGILDVLDQLLQRNRISPGDYYDHLHRMRAGNLGYLPISRQELLYQLSRAKVVDGEIAETEELATIRRYFSAIVLRGEGLQRPPLPENWPQPTGEMLYFVGLAREAQNCITDVWRSNSPEVERAARINWILDSLYMDYGPLQSLSSPAGSTINLGYLNAVGLTNLVILATQFTWEVSAQDEGASPSYGEWLDERILRRRFAIDSSLRSSVAIIVKQNLVDVFHEIRSENTPLNEAQIQASQYRVISSLPLSIQEELVRDSEFRAEFGLEYRSAVEIGDWEFAPKDFWSAVSNAVNGRPATVSLRDSDVILRVQRHTRNHAGRGVVFEHPVNGERSYFYSIEIPLLFDSPAARRDALTDLYTGSIDLRRSEFEGKVDEIVSIPEPEQRVLALNVLLEASAAFHFNSLRHHIRRNKINAHEDVLALPVDESLRFWRLDPSTLWAEGEVEAAAQRLISDAGVDESVYRFSGLPIELAESFTKTIIDLESAEFRRLVKFWLRKGNSPIPLMQLVKVLIANGNRGKQYVRLARLVIRHLVSVRGKQEFGAFVAMLRWTYGVLSGRHEFRAIPEAYQLVLAWGSCDQVFRAFTSVGVSMDWVQRSFDSRSGARVLTEFDPGFGLPFDVAYPAQVDGLSLMLIGLSWSMNESDSRILDEDIRAKIASIAFHDTEQGDFPSVSLLRDLSGCSNVLNSFLAHDHVDFVFRMLDASEQNAHEWLEGFWEQRFSEVGELNAVAANSWILLVAILGVNPPREYWIDRLRSVILSTDFADLPDIGTQMRLAILATAAAQSRHLKNELVDAHLWKQVLVEFQRASVVRDGDDLEHVHLSLLDVVRRLAVAGSCGIQESLERFSDMCIKAATHQPEAAPLIRHVLFGIAMELPSEAAISVWTALVRVRASR